MAIENSILRLLDLIPLHSRALVLIPLVVATAMAAGAVLFLGKKLKPPLIELTLARTPAVATTILRKWGPNGRKRANLRVTVDFFFIPFYTALVLYLCFWAAQSLRTRVPWLAVIGVLFGCAIPLAGVFDVVENFALRRTLRRAEPDAAVAVARISAWSKFGILGAAALFLLFRLQFVVFKFVDAVVQDHPRTTIILLTILTLFLGIRFLRIARPLHPPLLTMQLARSRPAANRVLHRWKPDYLHIAWRANFAEMWFAVSYAVTLAIVAFRASPTIDQNLFLHIATQAVGWYLLLAGTLHLVQNIGTAFAIRSSRMGWWFRLSRVCGKLRLAFLTIGASWLFIMFLEWEVRIVRNIGERIRELMGV